MHIFQSILGVAQVHWASRLVTAWAPADVAELAHSTSFKQALQAVCNVMSGVHICLWAVKCSTKNNWDTTYLLRLKGESDLYSGVQAPFGFQFHSANFSGHERACDKEGNKDESDLQTQL